MAGDPRKEAARTAEFGRIAVESLDSFDFAAIPSLNISFWTSPDASTSSPRRM
jgi:hypothetical protein